ncbi:MAG: Peroxyureidoacrylate/ureidoacrylate amidohydrolase RutB [Candidatus Celerinatantimonas neptuna]|nr:MAG: Peroxyureidoacrylate/ureidoacrylate amidohydrolase RutB [Candidatus Celerinatantimonas neptuna]
MKRRYYGKVAVLTNNLQYTRIQENIVSFNIIEKFKEDFPLFLQQMREMGHAIIHLKYIDYPLCTRFIKDRPLPVSSKAVDPELIREFVCGSDIVVCRSKESGFYQTLLDPILKLLLVDTIVVAGFQMQSCIQATAADAYFHGYNVWIARDGMYSLYPENKKRTLTLLSRYCATVLDLQTIIDYLKSNSCLPAKIRNG